MEEKLRLSTEDQINKEEDGGEDEEFYEKIEAPKFVDFKAPDRHRPDDRYWFCLRVGCDQKHEEEMDPEAISKNFVLRVMAARSPNIRLRKALNRKASSVNEQCPRSAPAKPSKSGLSRLAATSSISQKMVDVKAKAKQPSKLISTPNANAKQVAAKYLTTPRNKNCLPNPNSFRSVQNPKQTSIAVPKNRMVAKALVFHSPKKAVSIKKSSELRTPLTKICEGMKRLEITSQRKRVLGYSNRSSNKIRRDPNKSLPVDPSRRQLSACKDRSKAKELLKPANCKEQETKSLRRIKRKSKGNSNKPCNSMPKKTVENDSSNMEIDRKSRDGSGLSSSRINEGNVYDEQLTTEKTSVSFDSIDSIQEETIPCLEVVPSTKSSRGDTNSSSNSEEGCLEEHDFSKFQANSEEGDKSNEGIDQEEKTKASSEKRETPEDRPTESQTLAGVGDEGEAMDGDDKENASAYDGNRDFNHNKNHHSGQKILGKQETSKITKKVAQTQDKNLKEGLTVPATGAHGVKYKKPKPTNPKPFRLRTDERRILKEANLERRMQSLVPQQETATVSMLPGRILHRRHRNEIQKQSRTAGLSNSEGQVRPRTADITPQRHHNLTQQKPIPKSENSLRKTKSPSLQGQFISPRGIASTRKPMASYLTSGKQQLGVIKETSSMPSRSKEAREPSHGETNLANKATTSAGSRSLSRGKRPMCVLTSSQVRIHFS